MKIKECFGKLTNNLQKMDLFGQMATFQILGETKFSTSVGVTCTFSIIIICILYFASGISSLLDRSYPTIIQTDQQVINTSAFPLLPTNFTLAISIADSNQNPLNTINTYFTITVKNCHYWRYKQSNGTVMVQSECISYPTEPCGEQHFVTDIQKEFFSNIRLGAVQCLEINTWTSNPPKIQGIKSSTNYSQLTITFSSCVNTTSSSDCAPQTEITEQLLSGYYVVYLSDTLIQMGNTEELSKQIIQQEYTSFSLNSSKEIYQGYKILTTSIDYGLFLTNIIDYQNIIQNSYRESTDLYNSKYIIQHSIILDNKSSVYVVKYQKLLSILGGVGGLYQILFLLMGFMIKPITNLLMQISLANELFRFQESNDNGNEKQEAFIAFSEIIKNLGSRDILIEQNIDIAKKVIDYWDKRYCKIKSNFKSAFIILFGCDKSKKIQVQSAESRFLHGLDITNILTKLYEIDKLKYILLTPDQRNLFECLPKPIIKRQNTDLEISALQSSYFQKKLSLESPLQYIEGIFESFQNIILQKNMTKVDNALIRCLDDDIKKFFSEKINYQAKSQYFEQFGYNSSSIRLPDLIVKDESISQDGVPQIISTNRMTKRKIKK